MTFKKEFKHTEQWKKEHSERMKGKGNPMFGDPREDLQIKFKGEGNPMSGKDPWNLGLTKETDIRVKKVSEALKDVPKSEEHKSKLRIPHPWQCGENNVMSDIEIKKKHQKIVNSKEFRENMSISISEMWKRPGIKEKLSESLKLVWSDPKYKERMNKIMKEVFSRPEVKAKSSERFKSTNPMYNPEVCKKISEIQKEMWSDPIYREKMLIAFENRWTSEARAKVSGKNSFWFGKQTPHGKKIFPHITPLQGLVLMHRWDRLLAKYYDDNNILYLYEPDHFEMIINNKECSYTPDFLLPVQNKFIEVKGWMRPLAKLKSDKFREDWSHCFDYEVLMEKDLKLLGIDLRTTDEEKQILKNYKLSK